MSCCGAKACPSPELGLACQLVPCCSVRPAPACPAPQRRHCLRLKRWGCNPNPNPQALRFGEKSRLPSIAMLERYGNTGCSSVFYILAQMESAHGVKAGEKVRDAGVQGPGLRVQGM